MGRDAGFVAMHAALAATIVDLVMIPEVNVKLEDIFDHVDKTLARKGFMVVAVAEGAGQEFVATGEKDATGHTKYGDIGQFMRDAINKHLKEKGRGRCFYIDPSYIIRSVPLNPMIISTAAAWLVMLCIPPCVGTQVCVSGQFTTSLSSCRQNWLPVVRRR